MRSERRRSDWLLAEMNISGPTKSELETLLGRGVDLIEPGAVRNPFVLASTNQHRESIYAA